MTKSGINHRGLPGTDKTLLKVFQNENSVEDFYFIICLLWGIIIFLLWGNIKILLGGNINFLLWEISNFHFGEPKFLSPCEFHATTPLLQVQHQITLELGDNEMR